MKTIEKRYKIENGHFTCDAHYYFDELEERFFYYPLYPEDTGFDVMIYVDQSWAFKRFEHPIWVYFQNTYNITQERNYTPILLDTCKKPENIELILFEQDYLNIQSFVYQFRNLLILLAHEELKDSDFVKEVRQWKSNNQLNQMYENLHFGLGLNNIVNEYVKNNINNNLLLEMATLEPEETGLPMKLWVDTGKEYLKGGHGHRVKFQYAPHIKETSQYATYTIPKGEVLNIPEKYKDLKKIELLSRFVEANKENLIKLADMQIGVDTFKEHMIKLDKKGYPISGEVKPNNYRILNTFDNNNLALIVKFENNRKYFNYLNRYGNIMYNEWFDWADEFRYSQKQNKWIARAGKNNSIYIVIDDGTLIETQY